MSVDDIAFLAFVGVFALMGVGLVAYPFWAAWLDRNRDRLLPGHCFRTSVSAASALHGGMMDERRCQCSVCRQPMKPGPAADFVNAWLGGKSLKPFIPKYARPTKQ